MKILHDDRHRAIIEINHLNIKYTLGIYLGNKPYKKVTIYLDNTLPLGRFEYDTYDISIMVNDIMDFICTHK